MKNLINAVLFQLVWFACVGGGASGWWWLGPAATAVFFWLHLRSSDAVPSDLLLVAVVAPMGLLIDTLMINSGLFRYPYPGLLGGDVAPIWIISLWVGFALTLNHSLAWLKGRRILAAVLCGIFGPFSFWVGATTWQAVDFTAPQPVVLAVLAVVWSTVTPALVWMAEISNPSPVACSTALAGGR